MIYYCTARFVNVLYLLYVYVYEITHQYIFKCV
jgi:hypothetical protein